MKLLVPRLFLVVLVWFRSALAVDEQEDTFSILSDTKALAQFSHCPAITDTKGQYFHCVYEVVREQIASGKITAEQGKVILRGVAAAKVHHRNAAIAELTGDGGSKHHADLNLRVKRSMDDEILKCSEMSQQERELVTKTERMVVMDCVSDVISKFVKEKRITLQQGNTIRRNVQRNYQ